MWKMPQRSINVMAPATTILQHKGATVTTVVHLRDQRFIVTNVVQKNTWLTNVTPVKTLSRSTGIRATDAKNGGKRVKPNKTRQPAHRPAPEGGRSL